VYWKYIESLKQSSHRDIPDLEIKNKYIELKKIIYGSEHRIIVFIKDIHFSKKK